MQMRNTGSGNLLPVKTPSGSQEEDWRAVMSSTGAEKHHPLSLWLIASFTSSKKAFFVFFSIYAALLGLTNSETIELKERCSWVSFIFVIGLSVFLAGGFFWALAMPWGDCFGWRIDAISSRPADFVVCTLSPWGFVSAHLPSPQTEDPENRRRVTEDLHPLYCNNWSINKQSKHV